MSADTPRPERVTLTDEEIAELVSLIRPWTVCDDGGGFDHGSTRAARRVAEWFAAREQALREEIKADLLAKCPHVHTSDAYAEVCEDCGYWIVAARIARGETR